MNCGVCLTLMPFRNRAGARVDGAEADGLAGNVSRPQAGVTMLLGQKGS
jgi:hypothetical protein